MTLEEAIINAEEVALYKDREAVKNERCEYCNTDSDGYVKPIEKNGHAFVRFGMNGWVISLRANGWNGECKIRYCPVCGRDLLVK